MVGQSLSHEGEQESTHAFLDFEFRSCAQNLNRLTARPSSLLIKLSCGSVISPSTKGRQELSAGGIVMASVSGKTSGYHEKFFLFFRELNSGLTPEFSIH